MKNKKNVKISHKVFRFGVEYKTTIKNNNWEIIDTVNLRILYTKIKSKNIRFAILLFN